MVTDIPINNQRPLKRRLNKSRRKTNTKKKRILFKLLTAIVLSFITATTLICLWLYAENFAKYQALKITIDNILLEKYHLLRTSEFNISVGMDLEAMHFLERLEELDYQRENNLSDRSKTFYIEGNTLFINTVAPENHNIIKKYKLMLSGPVLKSIHCITTGKKEQNISFPPINLTHFLDTLWEIRKPVSFNEIPEDLVKAVFATEDQNFTKHPGVDIPGMVRAMFANIRAGKVVQGGSTITQQTVKVLTKNTERSFTRKINEAVLAVLLESNYTKEELLTVYLNNVYLGHAAPFEIRGVAAAADYILGKDLSEVNLKECAMLAGLIRSPNSASPLRNPKTAAKRTQTVLSQMVNQGDPLAGEITVGQKLIRIRHRTLLHKQGWYFDQLARELRHNRIKLTGSYEQIIITTPLDPWMQISATRNLTTQLEKLEHRYPKKAQKLVGATVILDTHTGGVKALAGGQNYLRSPFNRAISAKRQIGSLIKPFIYLTALGGTNVAGKITQADFVPDRPISIKKDGTTWRPKNYDKRYKGSILARSALTESRNIPAVQIGQLIGLEAFLPVIKTVKIADQPRPYPSIFLGAVESTPVRMAGAYAAIANGGNYSKPFFISTVTRAKKIIYQPAGPKAVFAPAPCYVLTDMLTAVMTEGTAKSSKRYGFTQIAAGKTGTTNNTNDSWFAGFTPSLTAVTWVGRDDNKPCKHTGASGALPVWAATMNELHGKREKQPFPVPPGVNFLDIDPKTGNLASLFNNNAVRMAFVSGTSPGEESHWEGESLPIKTAIHKIKIKQKNRKKIFSPRPLPKQHSETWLAAQIRLARRLIRSRN